MSEDYKGMSHDAEEAYNKRQAEPLFKSAKSMMPMEQTKSYYDNLVCGYRKRDGCQILTRDKSLYACIYHQAMQSVGTDFFLYYSMINANEFAAMSDEQRDMLIQRHECMTKWLNDFSPAGARM